MNCQNCGYKYCRFHGADREMRAYLCEDFEPAEVGEEVNGFPEDAPTIIPAQSAEEET